MGSIPDWLMLGITTAAVAASIWFGVKGRLDGNEDRGFAGEAVEQSRKDKTISRQEQALVREAHKTSVESADAAKRSAAAAEA